MHSMSRTYSISEVPTVEDGVSERQASGASLPLLGVSPPLPGLQHAGSVPPPSGSPLAKAAEHAAESPVPPDKKAAATARAESLYKAVVYGLINAIVGGANAAAEWLQNTLCTAVVDGNVL
jgi:hypothetical protein